MRFLFSLLIAGFAVWMAWRGSRRGARRTLREWLPAAASLTVFVGITWLACHWASYFRLLFAFAVLLAVAAFAGVKRHLRAKSHVSPVADEPRSPSPAWLQRTDRIAGGALGLFTALVHCLLLGVLVSTGLYACTVWGPERSQAAREGKPVTRFLQNACLNVADATNAGLVTRIPYVAKGSEELHALIHVLNAPKDEIERLADEFEFRDLADLPVVSEALLDDEYVEQIQKFADGKLFILGKLAESEHSRKLLSCPEFRDRIEGLTPSQLYGKLKEIRAEKDGEKPPKGSSQQ